MNILMHNYFRFRNTLQISNNSLLNHSYLNLPDLILFPTNEFLKNNSISFNPRVTEKIHTCMHKLSLKMRLYCSYCPTYHALVSDGYTVKGIQYTAFVS